jgi:hypothetical protein
VVGPGERVTVGCPLSTFFGLESMFLLIVSCPITVFRVGIVLMMYVYVFYIAGGMGEVFMVTLTREMCVLFLCDLCCL